MAGAKAPTTATWAPLGPQPIANYHLYGSNTHAAGVNVSGRVTALVTNPSNPAIVYAGGADGGVWESTDSGAHWTTTFDQQPSLSIGALGIDAAGSRIYAGTGEFNNNGDAVPGQGIMVSTDAGASWTVSASSQALLAGHHVGGIAVDRTTSGATEHVFAATDVGLFESTDGGATWSQNTQINSVIHVITGTASGAVYQIVQDPTVAGRFYAVAGDNCATESGDILVSNDGGTTWANSYDAQATFGQAASRIALGVGPSGRAYAVSIGCAYAAPAPSYVLLGLDFQQNFGSGWAPVTGTVPPCACGSNYLGGQGFYDNVVAVDPTNPNVAVFAGVDMIATTDGGAHFHSIANAFAPSGIVHSDFHALAFTGANSFYVGNDGGVWSTTNLGGATGKSWTNLNAGLSVTQFYAGSAVDPTHFLGGAQDNSASGYFGGSPSLPAWTQFPSNMAGDGAFTALDPTIGSTTLYMEDQNLSIRKGSTINASVSITASPCNPAPTPSTACGQQTAFVAPFVMDPNNPKRLLAGTDRVWESTTGGLPAGTGWKAISPPLTVKPCQYTPSVTIPDYLTSIVMGPAGESNTVMTGSYCGAVWRTTNTRNTAAWTDITGNLPPLDSKGLVGTWSWVSSVAFNPWNLDEAWVTVSGIGHGHVFYTSNAGAGAGTTWTDITTNLPDAPVLAILVDPRSPGTVYIGTATGVMVCTACAQGAGGANWSPLGSGLPNVWVSALSFTHDLRHLVAWTHGRGAWIVDVSQTTGPLITEYPLASGSMATLIANGANGLWYTLTHYNQVGKIDNLGNESEYTARTPNSQPYAVGAGPDDTEWFAEFASGKLGHVLSSGTVVETIGLTTQEADGVTTGPDGNIWASYYGGSIIRQVNPYSGKILKGCPTPSGPRGIVTGPDGNIWFAEPNAGIGKLTPSTCAVTVYATAANSGPDQITVGPDGNLWFSQPNASAIGRITPSGTITEFPIASGSAPLGITSGVDGNLWFAETGANKIGRIATDGSAYTEYAIPTSGGTPWGVATGPDGNIWFTEHLGDKIGMLNIDLE